MNHFQQTRTVIEQGIERGLHHGMQVYLSRAGKVLANFAVGTTDGTTELTTDHWMLWLSSGKPLTAVAVARYWQAGELSLDDHVANYLPEFAQGGKERVTIRHLLTHTGGFRLFDLNWQGSSWNQLIDKICQSELEADWIPGETAGYHPASSWYVLGEILCRTSGKDFSTLFREEICERLGMPNTWNGIPEDVYAAHQPEIAPIWYRTREGLALHPWHEKPVAEQPAPGGNTRGPIQELGRFYENLLQMLNPTSQESASEGQGGVELLSSQTAEAITARHRTGVYDQTFRHIIDFGLGFLVDSKMYGAETLPYSFGSLASQRAFGHGGSQSSLGWADPESQMVVAVAANGMPGEPQNHRRNTELMEAIRQDLEMNSL